MNLSVHRKKKKNDEKAVVHSHNVMKKCVFLEGGGVWSEGLTLCWHWMTWEGAGTAEHLLERERVWFTNILWSVLSPFTPYVHGQDGAGHDGLFEKKSVFFVVFFLRGVWSCGGWGVSEHTKTFGIGDGFQQSLSQLLLAAVLGQQQHVKASVRCR